MAEKVVRPTNNACVPSRSISPAKVEVSVEVSYVLLSHGHITLDLSATSFFSPAVPNTQYSPLLYWSLGKAPSESLPAANSAEQETPSSLL